MIKVYKVDSIKNLELPEREKEIISFINSINNVKSRVNYINISEPPNDNQYFLRVSTLLYTGFNDGTQEITISYSKDKTYVLSGFPSLSSNIDFESLDEMRIFIDKYKDLIKTLIDNMYEDIRFYNNKNIKR